ncbi:tetratricopeptide repeat protein [Streptomyces sp. NPDC021020]|uniref:tetratricopeptide repeat protein n=1 Tax=Streptomyces sp. NPDC021020 TaxID=3365109 RepID=UPI0037A6F06C
MDDGTLPRGRGNAQVTPLPPPPAGFCGRKRELAELAGEIGRPGLGGERPDAPRVLLVAGRPGTGRTALAQRLAEQVADRYPDGQWFVRLTGPAGVPVPAEEAARGLLRALDAPEGADLRAATAGRRLLLVLDDVASADQLTALLPASAGSLVVATSGGPLPGVPDVRPCTLGGLDTPAAVELLARAIGETRVTCDPRGAESLVHVLAGHPTALRLTAAWLAARPGVSVADAALRLRDIPPTPPTLPEREAPGISPGTGGSRGAAGRGASAAPLAQPAPGAVRRGAPAAGRGTPAALPERGASALPGAQTAAGAAGRGAPSAPGAASPSEREAPGISPGTGGSRGAAGPGASAVPGAQPVPGAAGRGVPAVPGAQNAAGVSGGAVAPGELVRAFRMVYEGLPGGAGRMLRLLVLAPAGVVDAQGASALAGCPVEAAQGALEDFVRGGLLAGGAQRYAVPGCLEGLLGALLAARETPADVTLARARMLERTVRLLLSCRAALAGEPLDEAVPRAQRFDSAPAAAGWLEARLPALLAASRAAVADGELDTLARRLVAALVRALAAFPGGDAMAAERYELHTLVLGVAERRGLRREEAAALINLGDLDARAGRTDRALDRYRIALDAARAADDRQAEGRVLESLGGTYLERRDPGRALDWYGRALSLRQGTGEQADQARLRGRIAVLLAHGGRFGPALREWRKAAGLHKRLGDLTGQARALAEAARVQEAAGRPEDAMRSCRDALYWARQAGDRRLEAALLLRLADLLDRLGDPEGARLQRESVQRMSERASAAAAPGTAAVPGPSAAPGPESAPAPDTAPDAASDTAPDAARP